jgi:mannose-6-phosphate isomerase
MIASPCRSTRTTCSRSVFRRDENGKTEAWVVMDARPGSLIYAGFREEITPNEVEQALSAGTLESLLHRIEPKVGDCYFIPAGTVHALGEGVVVAEVQQSSDLTFRLYDWGRVDQQGQPRPLHIQEALQCIQFDQGPVAAVVPQVLTDNSIEREELLVSCGYFRLFRRQVKAPIRLLPSGTCRVLMVLSGSGELRWEGERAPFSLGQTCLLPASSPLLELTPDPQTPWQLLLAEVI